MSDYIFIPKTISGVEVTNEMRERINAGEAVFMQGLLNKSKNEIYNSYVYWDKEKNKLAFSRVNPFEVITNPFEEFKQNLSINESILRDLLQNRIRESYDFFLPDKGNFTGRLVFRNKKVEIDNSICQCPKCGVGAVYEGKKAFNCTNWHNELKCDFTIWKEIKGKTIIEKIVRELCENGETVQMNGFFSLKGEELVKKLVLTHDNKKVIVI
jgi:hypothetical protein